MSFCTRFGALFLLLTASLPGWLPAAHGQALDATFAPFDARTTSMFYYERGAQVVAVAPAGGGRTVVAGRFEITNGVVSGHLTRVLPNGAPDPTFNPGGAGANGEITQLKALAGGQWLIGGSFTRYNGTPVNRLARLTADGALDPSFNPGGAGADAPVTALAVDGNGRLLVAGNFAAFNGQVAYGLVRLLPTGALDASFNTGQGLLYNTRSPYDYTPTRLVVDGSGRILLAGATRYNGVATGALIRLLPTGALDGSFNAGGTGVEGAVLDLLVTPTGAIWVAGRFYTYNGAPVSGGLFRLLDSGALDGTFMPPPSVSDPDAIVLALAPMSGGRTAVGILGVGFQRLLPTGANDPSFTLAPIDIFGDVLALSASPGDSLLVGGNFTLLGTRAVRGLGRLTPAGAVDGGFTGPTITKRPAVGQVVRLGGDSLAVYGDFRQLNGAPGQPVVRLLPNGQPDPAFTLDPGLSAVGLNSMVVTPTNHLLVSNGIRIWRLTHTGAVDLSFDTGAGTASTGVILEIAVQPDGRMVLGGTFREFQGIPAGGLVRLLPTGAPDPLFIAPPVAPDAYVSAVAVRPDGHLIYQTIITGTRVLIGLLPSGLPDPNFGNGLPVTTRRQIRQLVARPDTTLLMLTEDQYQASMLNPFRGPVGRLTREGTVDPTYLLDPSLTPVDRLLAALALPDGSVLFVSGPRNGHLLRRLTPDGALDPAFTPVEVGTGAFGETVISMVAQSNNRLVLAGGFADVTGIPVPGLARLTSVPLARTAALVPTSTTNLYPNPATDLLTIERRGVGTAAPASARLYDAVGRLHRTWVLTQPQQAVTVAGLPPGLYSLRVETPGHASSSRQLVIE